MMIYVYKDRIVFSAQINVSDGIDIGMFIKENNLKIDDYSGNKITVKCEMKILALVNFDFNADILIKSDKDG